MINEIELEFTKNFSQSSIFKEWQIQEWGIFSMMDMIDWDDPIVRKISELFLPYYGIVSPKNSMRNFSYSNVVYPLISMHMDRLELIPNISIQYLHFPTIPTHCIIEEISNEEKFLLLEWIDHNRIVDRLFHKWRDFVRDSNLANCRNHVDYFL